MTSSKKVLTRVKTLSESLDRLDDSLGQLFTQSLPETLISLDTLQRAKFQVALPYLINDLVFGVDPKTHPVVAELDRVRQYFDKLKKAEGTEKKRRTEIDKGAANRFIKHAIAQAQADVPKNQDPDKEVEVVENTDPGTSKSALERVPVKKTSKMIEREKYQEELQWMLTDEEEEEEMLEMYDDADPVDVEVKSSDIKGKAKAENDQQGDIETGATSSTKRQRRKHTMDPFIASGFGDDDNSKPQIHEIENDTASPKKKSRKLNTNSTISSSVATSSTTTTADSASVAEADGSSNSNNVQKISKKRRKKKFKAAKGRVGAGSQ